MENSIALITEENIKNKIYNIRGQQVMIDSDLAKIYGYTTKDFNRQVKNNIEKFDPDFMFQLTTTETENLRCNFCTSSYTNNYGGRRYLPYAFTEQGIYMLMTVLKGDLAVKQSKTIIRIFKAMKDYIINNKYLEYSDLSKLIIKTEDNTNNIKNNTERINLIEKMIFNHKEKTNKLFFEGQTYDAYSLLLDIFNKSKKEIIIIDNYIDKTILDVLSKIKNRVILITNKYKAEDFKKYKSQYSNVSLIINNSFHDRFIIIDRSILYHSGASFKDLGKKCFAINRIDDKEILDKIINRLEGITESQKSTSL